MSLSCRKIWNRVSWMGVFLILAMTSCKDQTVVEDQEKQGVSEDEYYEFQLFNLAEYDIPAWIYLPDETANIGASTKPMIEHTEDEFKWSIQIGESFELLIEDYGDYTDLIEVEKKALAEQDFFSVKYLIEEDDLILYERTLIMDGDDKASPSVGKEHKSYHVYGQRRVGNITYELQSNELKVGEGIGYNKKTIELMAKSIRSFGPMDFE